jgi:hypothetical protein
MEFFLMGRTVRLFAAAIAAVFLSCAPQGSWAEDMPILGQVTAFKDGTLTVKSNAGETVKIAVDKKTRFRTLTRAKFSDLKKGDFIASAGMLQKDGSLKALEVRYFPAGTRHPREVHRPDTFGPDSRMTNATVDAIIGGVEGRTFKVKYKGGEKTIVVPKGVLVMRQGGGTVKLLKPGAHVSVVARKSKDGTIKALRIKVGMNGLVPPT